MGIIKKLKASDFGSQRDTDIYPVTSTKAVYGIDGESLDVALEQLSKSISSNGLSDLKAEAYAQSSDSASVNVNVKNGNTLVFNFGLPKGEAGTSPSVQHIEEYIDTQISNQMNHFSIQIIYGSTNVTPTGGDWDGTTLIPPTGWYLTMQEVDSDEIYLSIGKCYDNGNIVWSIPSQILGVIQAPTSINETYIAVVYKQQQTLPSSPTGGSFDWQTHSFTAPSGWSINPVSDNNGWYSVRAFYSDNTSSQWTSPQEVAYAHKELSSVQLSAIARQVTIDAETLTSAINNINWESENAQILINRLRLDSEYASIIAGHVSLSSQDLSTIAQNISLSTSQLQIIAGNVDSQELAGILVDNQSIINTITDAAGNVASSVIQTSDYIQLMAGTIAANTGFLDAVAEHVNIDTEDIIIQARNGITLTTIDSDQGLKLGVDSSNPSIFLKADGSGYVAKQNLSWNTDGEVSFNGAIQSEGLTQNIVVHEITSSEQSVTISKDDDIVLIKASGAVPVYLPSICSNGKIIQVKIVRNGNSQARIQFGTEIYYDDRKSIVPRDQRNPSVFFNALFSATLIYYEGYWYALSYVAGNLIL